MRFEYKHPENAKAAWYNQEDLDNFGHEISRALDDGGVPISVNQALWIAKNALEIAFKTRGFQRPVLDVQIDPDPQHRVLNVYLRPAANVQIRIYKPNDEDWFCFQTAPSWQLKSEINPLFMVGVIL